MTARSDIKVGDIGTVYRVPVYDNDLEEANFDPSTASVKQIVFKMPGTTGLVARTATPAQVTIGVESVWCLTYTVTAADVAPWASATVGGFHQEAGPVSLEGYVEFSASQKWASSTVTKDQQGRPLRVVARLAAS